VEITGRAIKALGAQDDEVVVRIHDHAMCLKAAAGPLKRRKFR
jgi:hypothetical protein